MQNLIQRSGFWGDNLAVSLKFVVLIVEQLEFCLSAQLKISDRAVSFAIPKFNAIASTFQKNMKVICNQSTLNTNLALVSRVVPSKAAHPILGCVLMEANAESQQITLTAFDLSLGISLTFDAVIEKPGRLAVPAKLLSDIISRLQGELTLELVEPEGAEEGHEDAIALTITSSSGKYELRAMKPDDFPELPSVSDGLTVNLPTASLRQGLNTLLASSTEETKQILTGVHVTMAGASLEFAATDGHRLAVVTLDRGEVQPESEPIELTVPARSLRELDKAASRLQPADEITLAFEPGQIVFSAADFRLTSRVLEGQYPAYQQLLPRQFERSITVDRRQLLNAVERIAVLADQKNNTIRFDIEPENGQLLLSVEARDVGNGRESVSAQISGDALAIAFNVKYLLEGLKVLSTTDIQININTATAPVTLTPLGGFKMIYLVMPVQIRS